jgi:hypothetical protein
LRNEVLAIDQSLGHNAEEGLPISARPRRWKSGLRHREAADRGQAGQHALVLRSMVVESSPQDEVDAFEDPFTSPSTRHQESAPCIYHVVATALRRQRARQ